MIRARCFPEIMIEGQNFRMCRVSSMMKFMLDWFSAVRMKETDKFIFRGCQNFGRNRQQYYDYWYVRSLSWKKNEWDPSFSRAGALVQFELEALGQERQGGENVCVLERNEGVVANSKVNVMEMSKTDLNEGIYSLSWAPWGTGWREEYKMLITVIFVSSYFQAVANLVYSLNITLTSSASSSVVSVWKIEKKKKITHVHWHI